MTTLAVTGATGTVGGLAARLLVGVGLAPRLVVRNPSRAPDLGLDVAVCTYADSVAATAALQGVDVLFMVSGHESDDRVAEHRNFLESAAAAGVGHVVYTSFVGAGASSGFTLGRDHGATEDLLRASGMAWTFLRDNFYAEVFPLFADDNGVIRGPAGSGRVAAVSQRDVAAVAATVLADPAPHRAATYDLTGPEALTLNAAAQRLTAVTGRSYSFQNETLDEARASRAHFGAPGWLIDAWISTYTAIRDGELAAVSDDVPRLLGRAATTFDDAVAAR
jgi:uncharacterized protein YbjT (DUF2867 family)